MEYCGEWFLRERDAESLKSLAIESGVPAKNVELSTETTGEPETQRVEREERHEVRDMS